ncbi:pyridoxal-phosphate dependent enzyme, partial [Patescibacteria group bacterium]|nr:pyridoxal-phosphate dependent enzyme [Patescibacteria group bacterium]
KNLKEAYKPGIWDKTVIDEKINIKDEDAYATTRELVKQEGIFVGMSSGAAMYVALQKIKKLKKGLVVALLPDTGERYLSTKLFYS